MLKIIVISQQNNLDFWQKQFIQHLGPVDIRLQKDIANIGTPDLLVLDFSGVTSAKDALLALAPQLAGKPLVISTDQKDVDLAIEAIKVGAIGFLVKPFQDAEFKPVADKLKEVENKRKASGKRDGKIISLLSYKGGTGVSTAAVNLAYSIAAAHNKKTLLIDAAGFSNHCTVLLNVPPKCTLVDISQQGEELDENYLSSAVKMISENLGIIGGLIKPEDLGIVNVASIIKMLEIATQVYDYIVIDTPTHSVDQLTLSLLQHSHEILLLTTFDLLTVKDNRFYIQALKDLGIEESRIKPVINRQDWFIGSLEPEVIQKQLNHPIYFALPNDWNLCVEAANYGRPVLDFAPASPLAMAYKTLAGNITGIEVGKNIPGKACETAANKDAQKKGLFNWFKAGAE